MREPLDLRSAVVLSVLRRHTLRYTHDSRFPRSRRNLVFGLAVLQLQLGFGFGFALADPPTRRTRRTVVVNRVQPCAGAQALFDAGNVLSHALRHHPRQRPARRRLYSGRELR